MLPHVYFRYAYLYIHEFVFKLFIAIRLKIQTKSSHKIHKSELLRLDFVNLNSWIAIVKLFVEPVLQGQSVGETLLRYAVENVGADHLLALEKNVRAINFCQRYGFKLTQERKAVDDTEEFLIKLMI